MTLSLSHDDFRLLRAKRLTKARLIATLHLRTEDKSGTALVDPVLESPRGGTSRPG